MPYAGPEGRVLAADLWRALRRELYVSGAGFGSVREVASGQMGGGDVDSGPVVFGLGVSATGFAIGGARQARDRTAFRALHRTAWLLGAPVEHDGRQDWRAGGALGNALMLALTTARSPR